jgi:hypothetical protein
MEKRPVAFFIHGSETCSGTSVGRIFSPWHAEAVN